MKRRKVVLLGPSSPLGTELRRGNAGAADAVELLCVGRERLDLTVRGAIADALDGLRFDALVNCAGLRDPDAAERDPAHAFARNGRGVGNLAFYCRGRKARFVHISSDFVFGSDARRSRPWLEDDATGPVNVLGASVVLGETLAEQIGRDGGEVTIVRTGPLFAQGCGNFVESIIRGARQGEAVVCSQYVSPTAAADVARFLLRLLRDGAEPGRYHVVNGGATSRFALASAIVNRLGLAAEVRVRDIESPTVAKRPRYSVLDNVKAGAQFGTLPPWQEALDVYLRAKGHTRQPPRKPRRWLGGAPLRESPAAKTPFIFGLSPGAAAQAQNDVTARHGAVGLNTGNIAFAHAIDAHLGGGLPAVEWGRWEQVNRMDGIAVVPAANQLGGHTDYHVSAQAFCDISVPAVLIGLGAQSTPLRVQVPQVYAGTVDWVRQIAEHAPTPRPNIAVRGSFTRYVLDRHGLADHAEVIGCPSLFLNPCRALGTRIAAKFRPPERIAVAAGHHGWRHLRRLEASLTDLVTDPGGYVVQSPQALVRLASGEAERIGKENLAACRDYVRPGLPVAEFVGWMRRHARVFYDVPSWLAHYRQFDFVVGTRIHGTILGLQAGVPSLCIVHDMRMLEVCQTLKVPHVRAADFAEGISREELVRCFDFDAHDFDRNRRQLCARYVAFLKGNGLPVVDWLRRLAADDSGSNAAGTTEELEEENAHEAL